MKLILPLALALVVGAPAASLGGCLPRRYVAEVVQVIDGDTLILRVLIPEWSLTTAQRVRLLGVAAPEMKAKEAKESRRARSAKRLVDDLIGPSRMVEATSPRCARGYSGRPLVKIKTMSGKDLAEEIKKAGLEK